MKIEELKEALLSAVNTICEEYAEDRPTFAVGDWVIHPNGKLLQYSGIDEHNHFIDTCKINAFGGEVHYTYLDKAKLWEPTEGEYAIFWNNSEKDMCISRFKPSNHNYVTQDGYQYVECRPLEYAMTLKDK